MGRKKISTTIYLEPEQVARLAELSRRTKIPQAVYFRQGLDLILDMHSEELPGQRDLPFDDT